MEYGIKLELPENDPMAMDSLLGDQFPQEKWFSTEQERDAEYEKLSAHHPFYRREDYATMNLTKLERES